MPNHMFVTNVSVPNNYVATLLAGENAYVAAGVTIASEAYEALHGDHGYNRVDVFGNVIGSGWGIYLGNNNNADTEHNSVNVFAGGSVRGYSLGSIGIGITLIGNGASIVNAGTIWGQYTAIQLRSDNGTAESSIQNSGLIGTDGDVAINRYGDDPAKLTLTNTGTIRGRQMSYNSETFEHIDYIYNSGTMVGRIFLGNGADLVDTSKGKVQGTIGLGYGNDTAYGSAAADTIDGGNDSDVIRGNAGRDSLDGGVGTDTVDYAEKTFAVELTLKGASASSVRVNGTTEDTIKNFERAYGGSGSDKLTGDGLANLLRGNSGNDTLSGAAGTDTIRGGAGKDSLDGGADTDTVDYADKTTSVTLTLNGATATTVKIGGVVEDTIKNFERAIGGSGADSMTGDGLANILTGGSGNDTLIGGEGNDTLYGDAGSDSINGGIGNDTIYGGADKDTIDGGSGTDTLNYADRVGVQLTLTGATASSVKIGGVAEDTIKNFERVVGGSGADKFTGDNTANLFTGNGGNDTLIGGGGNDTLLGGTGTDSLTGGTGADHFRFALGDLEIITDFKHGEDRIELSGTGPLGVLNPSLFASVASGASGPEVDDFYVYDRSTGYLYYDTNGGGLAGGQLVIAVLANKPQDLNASDIWLV